MAMTLDVNGKPLAVKAAPDTPLLWVLRDELGLTGSKFGCGVAQCGACTVLADGQPIRACVMPIEGLAGVKITTIESLGGNSPLQQAWVKHDVPQCGYCQSGQIMQAAALLAHNPSPSTTEIQEAMNGNLCRCATYPRIAGAVKRAAQMMKEKKHV